MGSATLSQILFVNTRAIEDQHRHSFWLTDCVRRSGILPWLEIHRSLRTIHMILTRQGRLRDGKIGYFAWCRYLA